MSDEHHEPTESPAPGGEHASLDEAAPGADPSVHADAPQPERTFTPAPQAEAAGGVAGILAWVQQNVAVAAGIAIAVVLVLGVGGYFLFSGGKKPAPAASSSGVALTAEQQAAIAQGVCGVAIARVRNYGVLPQSATLSSTEATPGSQPGFESCQAASDGLQYAMVVQVTCQDLSKADCVALDSVKSSDGTALYHRRPYSSQPMPPPTPQTQVGAPEDLSQPGATPQQ